MAALGGSVADVHEQCTRLTLPLALSSKLSDPLIAPAGLFILDGQKLEQLSL